MIKNLTGPSHCAAADQTASLCGVIPTLFA